MYVAVMTLKSTKEVISALGGIEAVAKLTDSQYSAVGNWSAFDQFPAKTYVILKKALIRKGHAAPDSLWHMIKG